MSQLFPDIYAYANLGSRFLNTYHLSRQRILGAGIKLLFRQYNVAFVQADGQGSYAIRYQAQAHSSRGKGTNPVQLLYLASKYIKQRAGQLSVGKGNNFISQPMSLGKVVSGKYNANRLLPIQKDNGFFDELGTPFIQVGSGLIKEQNPGVH